MDKSCTTHINCNSAEQIIFKREQVEFLESAEKRRKLNIVDLTDEKIHEETDKEMYERFDRIIRDEIVYFGR